MAIFVAAAALRLALVQSARFTGDEARDYQIGMDIAHGVRFPMLGPVITSGQAQLPGPFLVLADRASPASDACARGGQRVLRAHGRGDGLDVLVRAAPAFRRGRRRVRRGDDGLLAVERAVRGSRLESERVPRVRGPRAAGGRQAARAPRFAPGRRCCPSPCLVLPQLHSSAPVVWLALVPLAWGNIRRWNRRWLAVGIVVAMLLYIPLAIHEARTGFGNARAFIAETLGRPEEARGGPEPLVPAEPDLLPALSDARRDLP